MAPPAMALAAAAAVLVEAERPADVLAVIGSEDVSTATYVFSSSLQYRFSHAFARSSSD